MKPGCFPRENPRSDIRTSNNPDQLRYVIFAVAMICAKADFWTPSSGFSFAFAQNEAIFHHGSF
jgi:hypothetical protein